MSASYHFTMRPRSGVGRIDWLSQRDALLAMRANGSTRTKIAEHYGVDVPLIARVITALKLPLYAGGKKSSKAALTANKKREALLNSMFWACTGRDVPAQRACISRLAPSCKGVFASTGVGNRMCVRCRAIDAGGMD